jgi:hypothetical protein
MTGAIGTTGMTGTTVAIGMVAVKVTRTSFLSLAHKAACGSPCALGAA